MLIVPGFAIVKKLSQSDGLVVYQAVRSAPTPTGRAEVASAAGQKVLLKLPQSAQPAPRLLAALQHEFNLLRSLDLPGVVKAHSLEPVGSSLALVLEDFGGASLRSLFPRPPALKTILQVALAVAETLAALHRIPVLHKDLKPDSILFNPDTGEVKLADLSLASRLSQEPQRALDPTLQEGTARQKSAPRRRYLS